MDYKSELHSQIKESYGKLLYTYTAHWKLSDRYIKIDNWIKILEIVLCAITTTGLFGYIISNSRWLVILGAVFSALSLAVTLLVKEMNLQEKSVKHKNTADELWILRESYVSLLTDFSALSEREIRERRDDLSEKVSDVYKKALPTNAWSYSESQKALKNNEEQFFTSEELDNLVPEHLRIRKK